MINRELRPCIVLLILAILNLLSGCGSGNDTNQVEPTRPHVPGQPDVNFITTPDPIVDRMLDLAAIRPDDVVYDLGCGDGKILVAAAKKHGVKAVGIEIDPKVVELAKENVKSNGVEHLVSIRQGDIFEEDFSDATVVMMYLLPELNVKLMPKLRQLRDGTRIVSHNFDMKGAKPDKVEMVFGKKLYLWRVPWKSD
jgi:SAM-dependent methyltransferase